MSRRLIFALGALAIIPYGYALDLGNLRRHVPQFELAFFTAFGLYALAVVLALRSGDFSRRQLWAAFFLAALMQGALVFTSPTLSDDMYRYVWDGRLQAAGISPYSYPPDAPELAPYRDGKIWPRINRKSAVTVYPAGAELAFTALWRVRPDDIRWFQIAMGAGGLLAGALLVKLLEDLHLPRGRVLILIWSPLLAFETAHSAHVDGLLLPLLVGAWWARQRENDGLTGALLGLATAVKLYPALLFPALWRPQHPQGRWRMPVAFAASLVLCYLPYLFSNGAGVIGFLPQYFREQFNLSPLVAGLLATIKHLDVDPRRGIFWITLASLALAGVLMIIRPAADGRLAIRRGIWLLGILTLLSQNLFSWYLLWVLPLLALFLRLEERSGRRLPVLRLDAWTGWWLFGGLVALSYTFFIDWKPLPAAIWGQYLPLYLLLIAGAGRYLWERRRGLAKVWSRAGLRLPASVATEKGRRYG